MEQCFLNDRVSDTIPLAYAIARIQIPFDRLITCYEKKSNENSADKKKLEEKILKLVT